MSETDVAAILRAISEFQRNVDVKIEKIFDEIASVGTRVSDLETDKAVRDERRKLEIDSEGKRINWTMVRTLSVVAASGFLMLAAIKFLLLNIDKWIK